MNEQNNNTNLYTNLKNKQQMFIRCMHESLKGATTTEFSRKDLKQIANDHGIAWAPAWIVKDQKRMVKRGMYSVPELAAYRNLAAHPKDVVAECCEDVVGDKVDVLKDTVLGRAMTA